MFLLSCSNINNLENNDSDLYIKYYPDDKELAQSFIDKIYEDLDKLYVKLQDVNQKTSEDYTRDPEIDITNNEPLRKDLLDFKLSDNTVFLYDDHGAARVITMKPKERIMNEVFDSMYCRILSEIPIWKYIVSLREKYPPGDIDFTYPKKEEYISKAYNTDTIDELILFPEIEWLKKDFESVKDKKRMDCKIALGKPENIKWSTLSWLFRKKTNRTFRDDMQDFARITFNNTYFLREKLKWYKYVDEIHIKLKKENKLDYVKDISDHKDSFEKKIKEEKDFLDFLGSNFIKNSLRKESIEFSECLKIDAENNTIPEKSIPMFTDVFCLPIVYYISFLLDKHRPFLNEKGRMFEDIGEQFKKTKDQIRLFIGKDKTRKEGDIERNFAGFQTIVSNSLLFLELMTKVFVIEIDDKRPNEFLPNLAISIIKYIENVRKNIPEIKSIENILGISNNFVILNGLTRVLAEQKKIEEAPKIEIKEIVRQEYIKPDLRKEHVLEFITLFAATIMVIIRIQRMFRNKKQIAKHHDILKIPENE